jgi:hypothetical protein
MSLYPQQELARAGIISRGPAARQRIFTPSSTPHPKRGKIRLSM